MKRRLDSEATETVRNRKRKVVNPRKRLIINQKEENIEKQKQNINPIERKTQKEKFEEKKIHAQEKENDKKLQELEQYIQENFDSNSQLKVKNLMNIVKQELVEEKHNMIKEQFTFEMETHLFIDCLCSEIKPDFVDIAIHAFDENAHIRHHWKRYECRPSSWEGAVAEFESPEKAMEARSQLKYSKYLTVVHIQEVLDILIEAELRDSQPSEKSTILTVRGKKPFRPLKEMDILEIFKQFGIVKDIMLDVSGETVQVWYRYASHAIMAKLVLEKSTFTTVGRLSAEVIMTPKERRILGYMRSYIRDM